MSDSEQELSDLLHRAQAVRDLKAQPGWEILQDFVLHGSTKGVAKSQRRLVGGLLKSWDEYVDITGFLRGVDFVLSADDEIDRLAANLRERLDAA